jgi:hypothetical protein
VTACPSRGEDYGMITDITGEVKILANDKKVPDDLLFYNLSVGDELVIAKDSNLTVISYKDCWEWLIEGPAEIKISMVRIDVVKGAEDTIKALRKLPICFNPNEIEGLESEHGGGLYFRGSTRNTAIDPTESLRKEFATGEASNSTLITLIISDIRDNNIEEGRKYFEELKKRRPNSPFIKGITKYFE